MCDIMHAPSWALNRVQCTRLPSWALCKVRMHMFGTPRTKKQMTLKNVTCDFMCCCNVSVRKSMLRPRTTFIAPYSYLCTALCLYAHMASIDSSFIC